MAKVSVVIPTYNRRGMVEEAVRSVLAQTLDDVEIVVVDDGSTDGTADALKEFDEQIRYFYQENQGRSVARNRGARASMGEYLVFLDSDDTLLPQGLQSMASFLDHNPAVDIVYADGFYCDKDGTVIELVSKGWPPVDPENIVETLMLHNIISAPHLAMVRRSSLEALGYPYFDETLRGSEDKDFWLRLAGMGARFAYLDEPVGKYRLHETNASKENSPNWERRWRSVVRGRRQILEYDFFPTLSAATRRKFFLSLMLVALRDDVEAQGEILRSPQFRGLPLSDQAQVLYYVGVDNIVYNRRLRLGRERLRRSIRADGKQFQHWAIWLLSWLGEPAVRLAISLRRKWWQLRQRKAVDYSLAPHWRSGQ